MRTFVYLHIYRESGVVKFIKTLRVITTDKTEKDVANSLGKSIKEALPEGNGWTLHMSNGINDYELQISPETVQL